MGRAQPLLDGGNLVEELLGRFFVGSSGDGFLQDLDVGFDADLPPLPDEFTQVLVDSAVRTQPHVLADELGEFLRQREVHGLCCHRLTISEDLQTVKDAGDDKAQLKAESCELSEGCERGGEEGESRMEDGVHGEGEFKVQGLRAVRGSSLVVRGLWSVVGRQGVGRPDAGFQMPDAGVRILDFGAEVGGGIGLEGSMDLWHTAPHDC